MMGRNVQLRLCTALMMLNLLFIWGNSLLPAAYSQAFSDWVMAVLEDIPMEEAVQSGSGMLRKLAHFLEFCSLGFLLSWRFELKRKSIWVALPAGMVAACLDETIQMFVPERGPGILDVAIDTCGVLAGMLLLKTAYVILKNTTKHGG